MSDERLRRKARNVGIIFGLLGLFLAGLIGCIAAGKTAFKLAQQGVTDEEYAAAIYMSLATTKVLIKILATCLVGAFASTFAYSRIIRRTSSPLAASCAGLAFSAALVLYAFSLPFSPPFWFVPVSLLLPILFSWIGTVCSGSNARRRRDDETVNRSRSESMRRRTDEHIEKDRVGAEQYALSAAQRKQKAQQAQEQLVERKQQQTVAEQRRESTAKLRATARAAFLAHPAASEADFDRSWPHIKDELFKQHTLQLMGLIRNGKALLGEGDSRLSGQHMLKLAPATEPLELPLINLEAGARVGAADELANAARNGDVIQLIKLLDAGVSLDVKNHGGWTPLMMAVLRGHMDIVKILVERGVALEERNNPGWTALRFASSIADLEIMRFLIDCGADINSIDERGWSILMQAADEGNLECVHLLLECGADKEIRGSQHESALSIAMRRGQSEIAAILKKSAPVAEKQVS